MSVTPLGGEFLINTTLLNAQQTADVVVTPSGGAVAVWSSFGQDGNGWGVYGQRFDATGAAVGGEFLVNQTTNADQDEPRIAIDGAGNFVVAWHQGGNEDIYARLFGADGTPATAEFRVNGYTSSAQRNPDVAMDNAGNFIVTWDGAGAVDGSGIYARAYQADGTALSGDVMINSTTSQAQTNPSIAMISSNTAVVAWTDSSTGIAQIRGRRLGALAATNGSEFLVGAVTDTEAGASVAMDSSGNFTVALASNSGGGTSWDIVRRRYNASAVALDASLVRVNTQTQGAQTAPSIAMIADGSCVITWESAAQDGQGAGVFAQQLAADGSADGGEFQVNTSFASNQQRPTVAWNGTRIAVLWDGNGTGDADGVFGQLYDLATAANQPPVNSVPGAQTTAEDTALVFSAANGNAISVNDSNAGSFPLELTLSVTAGTLTLSSTTGLTFNTGDGSADATMTFTGTLTAINAALNGLTYAPATNATTSATLSIDSNDLGNGGTGGALADSDSVTITITAVNDAPDVSAPSTASTNEDTALVFSNAGGNAITLNDVDAGSGSMSVTLTASDGTMTLASIVGLSFTTGDGVSDAVMTFTGTLASVNSALDGLVFTPAAGASGAMSIKIDGDDQGNTGAGGTLADSATINITVNPVNSAPVLNGAHDFSQIDEDESTNTGELVSTLIAGKVTDIDGPGAGIAVIAVDNTKGDWQYSTNGGASWNNFGSPSASSARLLAADTGTRVRFLPDANYNGTVSPGITFRAWDQSTGTAGGTANVTTTGGTSPFSTATAAAGITVRSINDAPVDTVPASVTMNEDGVVTFSSANGNAVSIADVDAGGGTMSVNLASANGTLTLSTIAGLSFLIGDGTADSSLAFTGTIADINAALNGMTFTPPGDYNGGGGFAIITSDQGSSGTGGPLSDSDSFGITINAVNDAPINAVPAAAQTVSEDTPLKFYTAGGNTITVADLDATLLRVALHANNGKLTLAQLSGLTFSGGDGTADKDMTFDGSPADINAALDGLIFQPNADYSGSASVQIVTSDRGQTGSGGTQTDTDTIAIAVDAANDAPTIDVPVSLSTLKGVMLSFGSGSRIIVDDPDAGSAAVKVTLSGTHGVLSLASTSGLTFTAGDGAVDATMTFTGMLSSINSALNAMIFTPDAGFLGGAAVTISVDDQGNSGVGGAQAASESVPIEVVTEFRANTVTSNTQFQPAVAMDPSGNFVAVWSGNQSTGGESGYGIWAQVYDSLGSPVGAEVHVNATTANDQLTPAVAMDAAGNFVVAWASSGQDGNGWGIYARRFGFDGTALGGEIAVNVTTAGNQQQPAIAAAPDGSFVVTWRGVRSGSDTDVYARQFNPDGRAVGGEFRVNTNLINNQDQPAVAVDADGDFVVAWRSNKQDGSGGGVFARLYDVTGAAQTGEIDVNVTNSGNQDKPAVSMSPAGDFVVAWASGNDQDGDKRGVYARRFDAAAVAQSGELLVNTTTTDSQDVPTIAVGADGSFVIAWASNNQDGSGKGIYAQKFDTSGAAVGGEFRASGTTFNNQDQPAAALSSVGDLVILWQGNGVGDSSGVFGQFYRSANHAPLNIVPLSQQNTDEDTALVFSAASGSGISVGGGAGVIQVSIAVTHGAATLSTLAGLSFIVGDGTADDSMTFQGTQGAINAALSGLRFAPDADYNGPAQLRLTTTDSSTGTAKSDEDTVRITVNPVNDAPTATGVANITTSEDDPDTRIGFITSFNDVEEGAANLTYSIAGNTNPALLDVTIDVTTHQMILHLAKDANGSATITLRGTDGGGLSAQFSFPVTVIPVNDAPVLAADTGATVDQGASAVITTAMLEMTDVDDRPAQLTFTITALPAGGSLRLNGTALALGDTFTQADIDAGLVRYVHDGTTADDDTFAFTAHDAAGFGTAPPDGSFAVTIHAASSVAPTPIPPPPPAPPPGSQGHTDPPPVEVDTTDNSDKGGGGGGGDGGNGGSTPTNETHTFGGGGSGGGSGGNGNGNAGNSGGNATQTQDAAAPLAARPPEQARDNAANKAPSALAQKDDLSIASIDAESLPPLPPPPAPAPIAPPPPPPAAPVAFISNPESVMTQKLDELRKEVTREAPAIRLVAGSATVVSLGLSVLYVLWTIRAGYFLASLLSSMPAWSFVDPLPILDQFKDALKRRGGGSGEEEEDDESLETLVKGRTELEPQETEAGATP